MVESHMGDIPQVSVMKMKSFVPGDAIFQMKHNKALRLDVFPNEFYQVVWELIKYDQIAMFNELHDCNLPLYNLNFGTITLLPKQK